VLLFDIVQIRRVHLEIESLKDRFFIIDSVVTDDCGDAFSLQWANVKKQE
jgi:hypothetical protein